MASKSNIQVIYKQIPKGLPDPDKDFEIKKSTIVVEDVQLKENEVLVRTLYASVDPYMRMRMRDIEQKSYFSPAIPGKPMQGGVVAEVVKSNDSKYAVGDVVLGFGNWEEYAVTSAAFGRLKKIPDGRNSKVPLSYFLGVLGMPGMTAYVGLHKICEPLTPGQTLYVSAASGAVGQVVGQYAKSLGYD